MCSIVVKMLTISPYFWITDLPVRTPPPSKFTVLTLCTLLMRGLLAIAKLLVKFRHPFYPSNEQS